MKDKRDKPIATMAFISALVPGRERAFVDRLGPVFTDPDPEACPSDNTQSVADRFQEIINGFLTDETEHKAAIERTNMPNQETAERFLRLVQRQTECGCLPVKCSQWILRQFINPLAEQTKSSIGLASFDQLVTIYNTRVSLGARLCMMTLLDAARSYHCALAAEVKATDEIPVHVKPRFDTSNLN